MKREYEISSLLDFTKVPKDKLFVCISEFADWVNIMRKAQSLKGRLKPVEKFVWVDDKQRNITINIMAPTKGEEE